MRDKVNDVARLTLMRDAILNIEEFVVGVDSCNAFVSDKLLCHAVIYNLQCIGEGAYKLSRDYVKSHPYSKNICVIRYPIYPRQARRRPRPASI